MSHNFYNLEVAEDPNTSPDILKMILKKGRGGMTPCLAACNPNCPSDALKMVLERGKDDNVSILAAINKN